MTPRTTTEVGDRFGKSDARRNIILQQGLAEPASGACAVQYSALQYQQRVVALWLLTAAILATPLTFTG